MPKSFQYKTPSAAAQLGDIVWGETKGEYSTKKAVNSENTRMICPSLIFAAAELWNALLPENCGFCPVTSIGDTLSSTV